MSDAEQIKSEAPVSALKPENTSSEGGGGGTAGGGGSASSDSETQKNERAIAQEQEAAANQGVSGFFGMIAMVISALAGVMKNIHTSSSRFTSESRGPLAQQVDGPIAGTVNTAGGIGTYLYTALGMLLTGQEPRMVAQAEEQVIAAKQPKAPPQKDEIITTNLDKRPNPEFLQYAADMERQNSPLKGDVSLADLGSLPRQSTPVNPELQVARSESAAMPGAGRSLPS